MKHTYNDEFMTYTDRSSRASAQAVSKLVLEQFPIASVLDIGCARGAWLASWQAAGVARICGLDGAYVDTQTLVIPEDCFRAADLSQPQDLGEKFDLVQSLEVAEHVQAESADIFVENMARHASGLILFSAAPPGQGGEFHVNEQPYDYWRKRFAQHGYQPFDYLRPQLAGQQDVSFWYRYNMLLYVHTSKIDALPEAVRATAIGDQPIADISPPWFRARKAVVRCLPRAAQDGLARWAARRGASR